MGEGIKRNSHDPAWKTTRRFFLAGWWSAVRPGGHFRLVPAIARGNGHCWTPTGLQAKLTRPPRNDGGSTPPPPRHSTQIDRLDFMYVYSYKIYINK